MLEEEVLFGDSEYLIAAKLHYQSCLDSNTLFDSSQGEYNTRDWSRENLVLLALQKYMVYDYILGFSERINSILKSHPVSVDIGIKQYLDFKTLKKQQTKQRERER